MDTIDHTALPLDSASSRALAARGLQYRLVDARDERAFGQWLRADARGFYDETPDDDRVREMTAALGYRRTTGVFDDASPEPDSPVGTVSSWVTPLTVGRGRTLDMWAVSSVTVRPTHGGRGIARAMLEGELRTAKAAGLALAGLTVTESTLYGRYGFAPAAMTAEWSIRTSRVTWTGPVPDGRVEFVSPAQWRELIDGLYDRVRTENAGHIPAWPRRFDQLAGLTGEEPERAKRLQAARYVDEAGELRGLMLYRVDGGQNLTDHRLTVEHLTTETDDASAALWRLALTMPLVHEVVAPLRRTDEAVRWQIGDFRAATGGSRDNLWLRVLDVAGALEARPYATAGRLVLEVHDPLGFAEGTYLLCVAEDGSATVSRNDEADAPRLALGAAELAGLLLGGIRVATLAEAGRVRADAEAVATADALFRTAREPWLPFWF